MSRLKFYSEKTKFLATLIWWREWALVWDEWKLTYKDLEEAKKRLPELEEGALERLRQAIEEHGEHEENPTTSAPSE